MKTLVLFLSLVLVSACGSTTDGSTATTGSSTGTSTGTSDGSSSGTSTGSTTGSTTSSTSTAEFDPFTYETLNTYVQGAAAFTAQANGDNVFLATLFLRANKTFVLYYEEGAGDVSATGHSINTRADSKRKRSGTWSVGGGKLEVGDFLSCIVITVNGSDGLYCSLNTAIGQDVAIGSYATLKHGLSAHTPDESQWADYE